MCMMLGNKYLLDSRFRMAKEQYYRCYRENEERMDALLLALLCCARMGDLSSGKSILDTLIRAGEERIEVKVPSIVDETFIRHLESFIENEEKNHNISFCNGKLSLCRDVSKERA